VLRTSKRPRWAARSRRRLLLLAAGALLAALLYYRPVHAYLKTRDTLAQRATEVHGLAAEKHALEQRLALTESESILVRRARRLGLVKPGERLFIVKGIAAWRRAQQLAHDTH
jgi:cell division protein FtsB